MQEVKIEVGPELMEECGRYYIRNPDYTIQYEILISYTRIVPRNPFGQYLYICALWDMYENKKSVLFPVLGNTRNEARHKIAQNYEHYLQIGGS